jgi:hypothetical protein
MVEEQGQDRWLKNKVKIDGWSEAKCNLVYRILKENDIYPPAVQAEHHKELLVMVELTMLNHT